MTERTAAARLFTCDANRILIMGCPGSGKSTFARLLTKRTGLPLVHLDDLYWQSGWERPTEAEWDAMQEAATAKSRWIIDGNYQHCSQARLTRAQRIVIVYAPTWLCAYRIIARAFAIKRGDYRALPTSVRAQAERGEPIDATRDFKALLLKVILFNRVALAELAARISRDAPEADVILVSHCGRWAQWCTQRYFPKVFRARAQWISAREAYAALDAASHWGSRPHTES